ncbi:glycosyltransferase family 2 protein [bacterium]|nr:glycosyltransferase family 2 protein [bacterium]
MNARATVVVVTYNSKTTIGECLDSLTESVSSGFLKVVVVDNASSDGTAEEVERSYSWVHLVRNDYNGGFAAGNNLARSYIEGNYCFFLNPDSKVGPYCSSKLVDFLDRYDDVACVGPAVLNYQLRKTISYHAYTGLFTSLWAAAGLQHPFPLNRIKGRWRISRKSIGTLVTVDRLIGAALMIRREALDQIGWFDERFFLFSEEEDLCLRLSQAGWKIYYNPEVYIIHRGAASVKQAKSLAIASANWSRYLYMRKHHNRLSAEISRFAWIKGIGLRYLLALLKPGGKTGLRTRQFESYRLSLKSLIRLGYFERELRPQRESAVNRDEG